MLRQMWRLGVASMALFVMTGCAGRVPNQAGLAASPAATTPTTTTPAYSTPGYSDPYSTSPGYGSTPYGNTYGNSPYGSTTPGYGSTTGVATNQQLVAQIDKVKNGSFLGIGKFQVTVKVSNPATVPLSGTLKVTILSSGKSIKDFNETVSVPAGQTVTRTYEDTRWKADNATVSVIPAATADPYAAYGTGSQTNYNSMGATGPYGMY
jgi:hypothetical protein